MANEQLDIRLRHDGTDYEMWAGNGPIPALGDTTRNAFGVSDDPFVITLTTVATTTGVVITGAIKDLTGTAIGGVKPVSIWLHSGAYSVLNSTVSSVITGTALQSNAAGPLQWVQTTTVGTFKAELDLGASADNCAVAAVCGSVLGAAASISI